MPERHQFLQSERDNLQRIQAVKRLLNPTFHMLTPSDEVRELAQRMVNEFESESEKQPADAKSG